MRLIIKETLLIAVMVIFANILLTELSDINSVFLSDIIKTILISLCIQPWVIYQFTH